MFAEEKLNFRGYALLIALPAIVLAVLGGVSLRNDSIEAALELKERGELVIAELRALRDAQQSEGSPSAHRFEVFVDDTFRLVDPPAMEFPKQEAFLLRKSDRAGEETWDRLIEAGTDEKGIERAINAIEAADLSAAEEALLLLRLGKIVAEHSPLKGLELHRRLMTEYFLERSETGTRVGVLGGLYLAEHAIHLADRVETLKSFGDRLLAYPEPFTQVYLDAVDRDLSRHDELWADYWRTVRQRWQDDQERRAFYQVAVVELHLNEEQPKRAARVQLSGGDSIIWRPVAGGKIVSRPYDRFQSEVGGALEILDVNQFFQTEIRFDLEESFGQMAGQEVARARIEADARWPGGEVVVSLVDPDRYFASVRQRRWLFGFLITVALISVVLGLFAIERAFRRQRRMSELRSNFVASVSHELRTPVASISLLSEELVDGAKDPDHYNRLIHSESQRLSGLVENVLDASRIERGLKEYEFEVCDISALVRATIESFRPTAARGGVAIDFIEGDKGVEAEVDPIALQRALRNLLDNAVKFSERGQDITVRVSGDEDQIRISVSDQGKGIDPKAQRLIFEPFQRLGSEMRRETTGVGLGLALVKHVVEGHGGVIVVESLPGKGTEFLMTFRKRQLHE